MKTKHSIFKEFQSNILQSLSDLVMFYPISFQTLTAVPHVLYSIHTSFLTQYERHINILYYLQQKISIN